MAIPIILYDENHERVGETYHRRAKQLVKSGRAHWLEEGHSLLLASYLSADPPTKEETLTMTESVFNNNGTPVKEPEAPSPASSNDLLMYLAKQNVAQKKSLIRHVVAYILVWLALFASFNAAIGFFHAGDTVAYANNTMQRTQRPMIFSSIGEVPQYHISTWPMEFYINEFGVRVGANAQPQLWAVSNTGSIYNAQLWHFVLGIMTAWGVWIAVRGIKVARRYMKSKPAISPRPDPVAMEYQRLRSMSVDSMA